MFFCEERHVYFFAAVGITFVVLLLIYLLHIFIEGVKLFVIARCFPPNVKKYGNWAVVTGSTDGIGKSYARELARRKMNIVLVSRNLEKLRNTARELEEEFKIIADIIQSDFTKGWELYQPIKDDLSEKEVGMLINNVGLMTPQPCYFLSLSDKEILDIIHVNITSALLMTTIVLPGMLKRKRGAIVTMSSLLSIFISPVVSCYGASKSAVNILGTALSYEKLPNIEFQTLILACVTTNLFDYSSSVWKWLRPFVPNADSFSSSAINTIGLSKKTTGYFGHSVQISLKLLPDTVQKYLLYFVCLIMFKKQITRLKSETTAKN